MARSANTAFLAPDYPARIPASGDMVQDAEWTIAGQLTLNRFIPMFKIPGMIRCRSIQWDFPILDSNGSPTVQFSIGTAAQPALFVAATTPGGVAAKGNTMAPSGINFQTTAETIVGITIVAAAATTNPAPLTPLYVSLVYKDQ